MAYLTKIINDKIYHFRATVQDHSIEIIQGIFYKELIKTWQGCGNHESAVKKQEQLIEAKLTDGFEETVYEESLENTLDVYDKAKWHFSGNFPEELDIFQAYVHTGMFLGWLIETDLVSEAFKSDHEEEIRRFKKQEMTGAGLFEDCCDGVLMLEDLSELGNQFAIYYFNLDTGQYLFDYETTLLLKLPTLYHVQDTWENYNKIKMLLDSRFAEWYKVIVTKQYPELKRKKAKRKNFNSKPLLTSITGKWKGQYTYGEAYSKALRGSSVKFSMEITQEGDVIKGICFEDETKEIFPTGIPIEGLFENGQLVFYKIYPVYSGNNETYRKEAEEFYSAGSIQYVGMLKKKFLTNRYYFQGTWDINASFLDDDGSSEHYSFEGTWTMKRAK